MKTIDTPYGRKTPELLCTAMDALVREPVLREALRALCCIVMDEYPSTDGRFQRARRYVKEFELDGEESEEV
jgi:hypothetical protein